MPARKPKGATTAPALNPGEQIRAARLARGWSQDQLGQKLGGINRQRVSAIEGWAPKDRPSLQWFLRHDEAWIELGLTLEFFAQVAGGGGECPCCKRPY